MRVSLHPPEHPIRALKPSDWDVDVIIEQVSAGLGKSVPEAIVSQTVTTLLAEFDDVPIKIFVPLLVRREAIDLLRRAPMEIEAKFTVPDPGVYWRLQTTERLAGYELSTQEIRNIRDTYLDTSQRFILAAGYSCRRRRRPEGILMTLKSLDKTQGAIHRRQEIEIALDSDLPPAEWPDSAARALVLELSKQKPLIPLFELRQTRIIRMLQQNEQPLAEFSLDKVSLIVNGRKQVYHELEIELLPAASEQILVAIVDYLQNEWHLQPEPRSKFERALTLVDSMPQNHKP